MMDTIKARQASEVMTMDDNGQVGVPLSQNDYVDVENCKGSATNERVSADTNNNDGAPVAENDGIDNLGDREADTKPQAAGEFDPLCKINNYNDDDENEDDRKNKPEPGSEGSNRRGGSFISRSIPIELLAQRSLSQDTFSFLIYTKNFSRPSLLAALVFCLQTCIFCLVTADVIDPSNSVNPFNFPANVESTVRVTEVLAIIVAIITQDDVRKAINLLRDGYDRDTFVGTFGEHASRCKWMLSIVLRALEGLLGLFVTFMLVMQSETVLDLLLNFSAMEFVSLIDDVAFSLTTEGFFGYMMQQEAKALHLMKYNVAVVGRNHNSWKVSLITVGYFIVLFAAMLTGWGIIFANQASGKYLCGQLFIQLDDSLLPSAGMLSGIFTVNRSVRFGARVSAYQEYGGMVAYCADEERWTLTMAGDGDQSDPCKDWLAASSETKGFDITETTSSQWYVRTSTGRVLPMEHKYIECYDCKDQKDFCGESSSYGTCAEYNQCLCADGRYGLRCEFKEPCPVLEVDPRSAGFVGTRVFSNRYYLLKGYEHYNRPVYTSSTESFYSDWTGRDIISFTGRRWVVTTGGLPILQSQKRAGTMMITPFISEAVDIDGRADKMAEPLNLEWHQSDLSRDVDVALICAVCNNETNPCHQGTCHADGSCHCTNIGASGALCQIPPTSNGRCDPFFNTATFEYDGGDCCESTCVSTDEFTCGKDESGYIDIGYPHCKATPTNQWISSNNPVYGVNSAARSGWSVALGGDGGTLLAVGDPGASSVRLFDKDGSNWVQRGHTLQGPANSQFGFAISLSAKAENARQNALASPYCLLAIGAPEARLVRVYQCQTNGCVQVGGDISRDADSEFGVSVSLSSDGSLIAIGAKSFDYGALVYKMPAESIASWELQGNPITFLWRRKLAFAVYPYPGYYVSLSGEYLVMGTIAVSDTSATAAEYDSADLVAQLHKWDTQQQDWVRVGPAISKPHYLYDTPRSTWPQKSIVLSSNGKVLAMGSSRSVDIYSWDETESDWVQRAIDLNVTDAMGLVGWSVDLSADGSTLAIGTSTENQNSNSNFIDAANIRVHKWNGTHYSQFLNVLPAGETAAVALTRDGKALAVGLPFSGKKGGSTTVYKFRTSSECDEGSKRLRISFTTDSRPDESRWTLQSDSMKATQSRSYDGYPFTTFVEKVCVPLDSCTKFTVFDSRGDGLDPPGKYSLMLEGEEIAHGNEYGLGKSKHIGKCDCQKAESLLSIVARENGFPMEWALSHQNQTAMREYVFRRTMNSTVEIFEECIPANGCWHLTNPQCQFPAGCLVGLDWSYNVTFGDTSQIDSGGCAFCPVIALGQCLSNKTLSWDDMSMEYSDALFAEQPHPTFSDSQASSP